MPDKISRLADFVPYLMSVTTNAVSDLIAGQYRARFGLKIPEWRIMAVLGDAGARTQRELVDATRMDKVAVNRACKELEGRGLVIRRPNNRDGRSHHIDLSPAGKAMHGEIMPHALEMDRRLFESIGTAERDQFKALLRRIAEQAAKLEESQKT